MDGWYYAQNGQSVGPDDQVWHQSMANWMPARKVPGLVVAAAAPAAIAPSPQAAPAAQYANPYAQQQQQYAPGGDPYYAQQSVIGYQGAGTGDIAVTNIAMGFLQKTRPWVMFFAVLNFLGAGLCAIGGIGMLFTGSMIASSGGRRSSAAMSGGGMMAGLAIFYFVIAFVGFLLGFFLVRYFSAIGAMLRSRRSQDLEAAMSAQHQYWRLLGISTITLIVLYLVVIVFVVSSMSRF